MAVVYKDIDLLTQKQTIAGTEKIPVSDTEYITPAQIGGTGAVKYSEAQSLTDAQKAQARENIGAADELETEQVHAIDMDVTPTANSTNPVTSGGVKSYVDGLVGNIESLLAAI